MAQTQVVGRVAVKIMPDTSSFKEDTRAELERIERQLKLTVATRIDMSGASREFIEELRKINKRNRQLDARKIRFFTTISTDGMATAVRNAVRELQYKANGQKVKFEVDDLRATGRIELELDQHSADKAKRKLQDWADDVSPLKVQVEPDIANGAGAALAARLQVLTRPRTVPILPELDNGAVARVATALAALSGARVLNSMFERLGNTLKNLDRTVPVIGSLALAIAGLAGWGLSAASNLAALSASLAQIGATSLLLPGLLGGMAVGLGITVAAFRDFNKVLPEVKVALSELQDTISANFWKRAAEPIRAVVDDLLPRFRDGVARSATELGGFFGSFATNLGTSLSPALSQMFSDLSGSIANASAGTDTFASIIATLGRVGTSYLPSLANWFVQIAEQFDAFLQRKGDSGLKQEIDQGIQALQDLGSVLSNTGGILAGVARAAEAAGGSTLGTLAASLERIHAAVDSPGFQSGLTGVFTSAHAAMQQIATVSGPAVQQFFTTFGHLLTAILPQVGATIGQALAAVAGALAQPAVFGGVVAMFNGIQNAVGALAPAMAPAGQALGALMEVIGAFATMLGPLVAAALVPLAAAFTALAPSIIPIIQLLGGTLTEALQQLSPFVQQLVPIIGELLGGAFQTLSTVLPIVAATLGQVLAAVAPLIEQLVSGLGPILAVVAQAWVTIMTALQPLIAVLLQLLTAVLAPLIEVFQSIVADSLPRVAEAFVGLADATKPLLDALLAVVNFLMPVLGPAIEFIAKLLVDTLILAIHAVENIFRGVVDTVMGIWNIFAGLFTSDWGRMWDGVKQFFKGIWELIVGIFEAVLVIAMGGLLKKGMALIKGGWEAAWGAIRAFGESIWNTIRGSGQFFVTGLKGLIDDGLRWIKSLWDDAWNGIRTACSNAWNGIGEAVKSGVASAIGFVKELPGKAAEALSGIGSTLLDAGKKLIEGLINGIKSKFDSVKSTLGDLTSKLTDWKGPAKRDRILLRGAGRLIIQGLVKGLESEYATVRGSLTELTGTIPRTDLPTSAMYDHGASLGESLAQGLASQQDAIASQMDSISDSMVTRVRSTLGIHSPSRVFAKLGGYVGQGFARGIAGESDRVAKAVSAITSRPGAADYSRAARVASAAVSNGIRAGAAGKSVTRVLNYYAAPGSISSEEDLFSAAARSRMVGW
ncbi:phage tail protein [Kitasatospora sp. NPDC001574]